MMARRCCSFRWRALQVFSEWRGHPTPPPQLSLDEALTTLQWHQKAGHTDLWCESFCKILPTDHSSSQPRCVEHFVAPPRALISLIQGVATPVGHLVTLVSVCSCEVWLLPEITPGDFLDRFPFSGWRSPHGWRIIYHQLYQKHRMRWDGTISCWEKRAGDTVDMTQHRHVFLKSRLMFRGRRSAKGVQESLSGLFIYTSGCVRTASHI